MKATLLSEPELEFGGSGRHVDVRFGLSMFGPLDKEWSAANRIRVGVVGTSETIEGVRQWIERCRNEIPAKASKYPHLFPAFPGLSEESPFSAQLVSDSRLERSIAPREINRLINVGSRADVSVAAAVSFVADLARLTEKSAPDVLVCAPPADLLETMDAAGAGDGVAHPRAGRSRTGNVYFHDVLKARALSLGIPLQMIRPETYGGRTSRRTRRGLERGTQDEATRAWNFCTALYYKAGGIPWRLTRDPSQLTVCYVGVSFYRSLDQESLQTSIAQVFNERGDGMVLRGAPVTTTRADRVPHLAEDDARALIDAALATYRSEHRTLPARLVIHKTSSYSDAEKAGFLAGAESHGVESTELVSVSRSNVRLFRQATYPPLRGTLLTLDDTRHALYTRGSVDFFRTYPGMYVPHPMGFTCESVEQTPTFLAEEILGLTKMNWNNTQFDGAEPITVHAARQVGSILRHVSAEEIPQPRYAFYM